MAFIVKGLVSDGTLPPSAKADLAAEIGNTSSPVRVALNNAGLGSGADDADIAGFVANPATATGAAVATRVNAAVADLPVVSGPDYFWTGESTSAQGGGTNQAPGSFLAQITGKNVFINAVGGETSSGAAARQGAIPLLMTPIEGVIPASGGVRVTFTVPGGGTVWPLLQSAGNPALGKTWKGTILGVHGTLSLTQPSGTNTAHQADDYYTFTRTTPGEAVAVKRPAPFVNEYGEAHREDIQIIWTGGNNYSDTDRVLADIAAMVQHTRAGYKRFLVFGVHTGDAQGTGTGAHTTITALNKKLENLYGRQFIDIRRYLIDYGLEEAGIAPTAQDVTDMNSDTVPASLRSDARHFNIAGREVIAKFVHERLQELGWEPQVTPAPPTTVVLFADDFNRADSANGELGAGWATNTAFKITNQKLTMNASQALTTVLTTTAATSPNHMVSANTTIGNGTSIGLVVRQVDVNNFYGVRINSAGNPLIYKVAGGVTTSLLGKTGGWTDGGVMAFEAKGSTLNFYVNGTLQLTTTHTDPAIDSGVGVGVRAASGTTVPTWDNFKVETVL